MIINNLTRKNHLHYLKEIFTEADELIIISPFLTNNLNLYPFSECQNLKKIKIVTTLKPFDKDQYSKIKYFKSLFSIFNKRNIEFEVLIENSLHGKIFIARFPDNSSKAIITSANFTDNGLRINNEWGILISNGEEIAKVTKGIINKVKYKELKEAEIDSFLEKIKENPCPQNQINPITLDLSSLFENKDNYYQITVTNTFWLKPIGVTHDLVSKDTKFDEVDNDLHFSKLKPKGIKMGDILICYAVGHSNILTIYKVKSEIKNTGNENDRWPYFVIGENLTPNYGGQWSNQNITITNQKNEALSNGVTNLTPSGKNSFGSLMRGADKLRLTPEFGKYLLDKISKLDEELKKI